MDFLILLFIFSNFFSSLHYSNEIPLEAYKAAELQDNEEYSKAVELYENALKISPGHPLIMYNLGTAYYANGEPDKAAAIFDSMLSNDSVPENLIPDITYNAGTSYLKWVQNDSLTSMEKLDISIDLLIKSLISLPSDRDSRRNLEIALRLKNQSQCEQNNNSEDRQDEQQDDNENEDQQDEQQDDNENEDQQDEQQDDNENEDQQDEQQDDNENEDQQDEQQDDNENEDQQDEQQDDNENEDQQDEQQDDNENEDQQDIPYNMTREQAERLLDAALNAPGEDTLSPMKIKGFPSGSW